MTSEILGFIMFGVTMVALLLGFPVALTLAGTALLFAALYKTALLLKIYKE